LYPRDDRPFAGTALAEGSHDCEAATKIHQGARRGAELFATTAQFVHVRLIMPQTLNADAWVELLQDHTTTCDLAHHVFGNDQIEGAAGLDFSLVISHQVGVAIDVHEVLRDALITLRR
jgi:hypothetical protein